MFLHKIVLSFVMVFSCELSYSQNSSKILSKAEERIEQIRKGDCSIMIFDESGKLIESVEKVSIEQTQHAFLFGSNIFWLFNPDHPIKGNEIKLAQSYTQYFTDLFNTAEINGKVLTGTFRMDKNHPDLIQVKLK